MHLAIVLLPLIAAMVAGLFSSRIGRSAAHWITVLAVGGSFLLSFSLLIDSLYGEFYTENYTLYSWAISGDLRMEIGFLVDRLTLLMMSVVTFVSLMVHIYTIGYMPVSYTHLTLPTIYSV